MAPQFGGAERMEGELLAAADPAGRRLRQPAEDNLWQGGPTQEFSPIDKDGRRRTPPVLGAPPAKRARGTPVGHGSSRAAHGHGPMSRILQGGPGRSEYICRQCAGRSGCAPVSDSVRPRALLLYALTASETGDDLAVRMKPFRAVAHAPPDSWGWGAPQVDMPEPWEASPKWNPMARGSHWRYDTSDSDQIWRRAAPFLGTPAE